MSGQNRRRERKQQLRGVSPTLTLGEVVRGMAAMLASDDPEWSEPATLALDRMPPAFADALAEELGAQRAKLAARGWSDAALADVTQLLWFPPEATRLERDLRLLALLCAVTARRAAA